MTKRKRYAIIGTAVVVACVGIALGVLVMLPAQANESKVIFDRIEVGMTRGEVEALLGEPILTAVVNPAGLILQWHRDSGTWITVSFENGIVSDKQYRVDATEVIVNNVRRTLRFRK